MGLISRVSSRTYRSCVKMRLAARVVRSRLVARSAAAATLQKSAPSRPLHTSAHVSAKHVTTHPEVNDRAADSRWEEVEMERYADQADVVIVGGGPAGLTAAIKLKKLANEKGDDLRICVFEKAAEFGRHTLSGA